MSKGTTFHQPEPVTVALDNREWTRIFELLLSGHAVRGFCLSEDGKSIALEIDGKPAHVIARPNIARN